MAEGAFVCLVEDETEEGQPASAQTRPKEPASGAKLDMQWAQVTVLLGLGFGGAILARYYAMIRFLPEIDWHESLTYLSVLALCGTGLLALYGLLLFLPGVIWTMMVDRELRDLLSFEGQEGWELCPRSVIEVIGLPFFSFYLVAHVPMLWNGSAGEVFLAGIVGLIPAAANFRSMIRPALKRNHPSRGRDGKPLKSLVAKYVLFFGLSALVSLGSLFVLYRLVTPSGWTAPDPYTFGQEVLVICLAAATVTSIAVVAQWQSRTRAARKRAGLAGVVAALLLLLIGRYYIGVIGMDGVSKPWLWMLGVCSLAVVIANLFVALLYRQSRTQAVIVGVVAASLLFVAEEKILGPEHSVSARMMAQFGVGTEVTYTMIPDDDKGEVLAEQLRLKLDPETGSVPGVRILSRLGRTYLLEVDGRRIVFPKEWVKAWESPASLASAAGNGTPPEGPRAPAAHAAATPGAAALAAWSAASSLPAAR